METVSATLKIVSMIVRLLFANEGRKHPKATHPMHANMVERVIVTATTACQVLQELRKRYKPAIKAEIKKRVCLLRKCV